MSYYQTNNSPGGGGGYHPGYPGGYNTNSPQLGSYAPGGPIPGAPVQPYGASAPPIPGNYPPPSQQPYQYPYPPPQGPPAPYGNQYPPPPSVPQQYYSQQPYYSGAPDQYQPPPSDPLWYLGTSIPPLIPNYISTLPGYDPTADFEAVRKATKGFGTNDALLISTLAPLNALQMDALAGMFVSKTGKTLINVLDSESSGWFKATLRGLALGPIGYDVELLNQAIAGIGTNETLLNELILARPSPELRLLMTAYRQRFGRDLIDQVRGDLSGKTERMFSIALSASRSPDSTPVDHALVAQDVQALYQAGQGMSGTDEMTFCSILINRSQPHLTAICGAYAARYRSLTKVIKSEFSGHMRAGLLYIVQGAKPKRDGQGIWRDAKLMEQAMAGLGTKDMMLVWRIVRAHWDRPRMEAIKNSYQRRYNKTLATRVTGETSGSYQKLLIALITGTQHQMPLAAPAAPLAPSYQQAYQPPPVPPVQYHPPPASPTQYSPLTQPPPTSPVQYHQLSASPIQYLPPSQPPPTAPQHPIAQNAPLDLTLSLAASLPDYTSRSSTLTYLGSPIASLTPDRPSASLAGYDPVPAIEAIRKATKGFGTNDALLISTLVPLNALQIDTLSGAFMAKTGKRLVDVLNSESSGWFRAGLRGLALGPLGYDVDLVHQAVAGIGTNETLLNELILARPSLELRALITAYRHTHGKELIDKVCGDLSGKTERMFTMALSASRPPDADPVNHQQVAQDVEALYRAGQGKAGTDEIVFCEILINRSQPHLTAICGAYAAKYRSLSKVIKSEFSGHMRSGLLHIVQGAKPKRDGQGIWRDAKLMEQAMAGFGTKDAQLVWRIVRAHWDRRRMEAIKEAYRRRYNKSLESRVAGETSGSYKKLMVALINK